MTALWASVAGPSGGLPDDAPGCADAPPSGDADAACEAWWTADERYVLRVAAAGGERWYVGELDAAGAADAVGVPGVPAAVRAPREVAPPGTRTMLVGRRRGHRVSPGPMRLHVRRPPRV